MFDADGINRSKNVEIGIDVFVDDADDAVEDDDVEVFEWKKFVSL